MSSIPNLGLFDGIFHAYSYLNKMSRNQTVKTLIKRRVPRHLNRVCTVSLCPTERTLCLYGVSCRNSHFCNLVGLSERAGIIC